MKREELRQWFAEWLDDYYDELYSEDGLTPEVAESVLTALRPVSREQLSEFKTCVLVDELRKREGVETHIAEPYQDMTVPVNGPAVVLVVID